MSATTTSDGVGLSDAAVADGLAGLEAAIDSLVGLPLDGCGDDQLLDMLRRLEAVSRRAAVVDQAVLAQIGHRNLAFTLGARGLPALLRSMLRIDVREARARVVAADAFAPRTGLTGEPLGPIYEHVATAQSAGVISARQARVIATTVDQLPDLVQAEHGDQVERELVAHATTFDPDALSKIARRYLDVLDPDGALRDAAYRERERGIWLHVRADGSGRLAADLTAQATARLQAVLDGAGQPKPAADGTKDPRSTSQRHHDALLDACELVLGSGQIPHSGGVTTTVILTGTVDDWARARGFVQTGHGVDVPTARARQWLSGDARMIGILWDSMKKVEAYSASHRIFTENQRLAMTARDGGCCFPGCDAPSGWCEAHHMTDWVDTRRTTISDGALLCGHHHREHQRLGWTGVMIGGLPHWIPPPWIDPEQKPRRNSMHDPPRVPS